MSFKELPSKTQNSLLLHYARPRHSKGNEHLLFLLHDRGLFSTHNCQECGDEFSTTKQFNYDLFGNIDREASLCDDCKQYSLKN